MHAFVTGATGFAGSRLCRTLVERGWQVSALVRTTSRAAGALDGLPVTRVAGDVRDPASLGGGAMAGVDVVFHLASAFREAKLSDETFRAVNVDGTRHVLEAAAAAGVGRVVHCSTVGIHGDTGHMPVTEESPPGELDDSYNVTKLEAERLARGFFAERGMAGVVVRPTVGYGPGEPRFAKLFRSVQKGRFVMVGSGETLYNMVYIDDAVDGLVRAAESPRAPGEVFLLGGAENITLNTLVRTVARIVGGRVSRARVPLAPVLVAGDVCERIFKPFGVEPPLHRRRVGFFSTNRAVDIGKARRLLGYAPATPLETGLARMADWYRETGELQA